MAAFGRLGRHVLRRDHRPVREPDRQRSFTLNGKHVHARRQQRPEHAARRVPRLEHPGLERPTSVSKRGRAEAQGLAARRARAARSRRARAAPASRPRSDAVVTYKVTRDNQLKIGYKVVNTSTDATVINLTNHTYFNLGGEASGDVYDQLLSLNSNTLHADRHEPDPASRRSSSTSPARRLTSGRCSRSGRTSATPTCPTAPAGRSSSCRSRTATTTTGCSTASGNRLVVRRL